MKKRWLRVVHPVLEINSRMENFMVTEVSIGMPEVLSSIDLGATLFASAAVAALRIFPPRGTSRNLAFDSRNSAILLGRRGLTVLRFNFKVELEAATEY